MSETSDNMNSMTGMNSSMNTSMNGPDMASDGTVRRVAQKAHEAVDRIEQTLGSSTDKVMNWQEEYGEMAREQVRANPLAVVAGAFAVGYLLAKLTRLGRAPLPGLSRSGAVPWTPDSTRTHAWKQGLIGSASTRRAAPML